MTTLLSRETSGVYAVAPTPFHRDGSLDLDSMTRLLDHYAAVGVDGVTILGELGEAAKLTQDEARQVARHVLKHSELPVVVGVTAPGFAAMGELAALVMEAGAAGVMIAPPRTLRSDAQVRAYYAEAAETVDPAPFALQDYPLRFSVEMSPALIGEIATAHQNCVMLKHEDWPGLDKIEAIRSREAAGVASRLSILCGNGGLFLDFELERGADGAMTGYCFPELLVDVVRLVRAGRRDDARDLYDAHLPLIRYEQQPNVGLAVRKHVLRRRGLLTDDTLRRPGGSLGDTSRREVDHLLGRLARTDVRAS